MLLLDKKPTFKAYVQLDVAGEPVEAIALNPGGWFGVCYVLQIAIANALNPFVVIEADNEQSAIDELADSEKWGHLINDDTRDINDENTVTAGNDSHPVNLDNVAFCHFHNISYVVEVPIKDKTDDLAAALKTVFDEWESDAD